MNSFDVIIVSMVPILSCKSLLEGGEACPNRRNEECVSSSHVFVASGGFKADTSTVWGDHRASQGRAVSTSGKIGAPSQLACGTLGVNRGQHHGKGTDNRAVAQN